MSPSEYEIDSGVDPDLGRRRRGDRGWLRGPGRWVGLGLAIAFLVGIAVLLAIPRTEWGRGQVLAITLQQVGGRLNGRLEVERLEGNLITGARLYQVRLEDTTGVALAVVDSAYVRYRVATLTGGDILIHRLDLYGAEIELYRMPGDTLWNYQGVLQDPTPEPTTGEPSATLIENLRLFGAEIRVRTPVEPDDRLPEARQAEELALILADTARWMIEEVPGGYLRANLISVAEAEINELFIGPDERGGTYLEVVDIVTDIRLSNDPPLSVRGAQAAVHLQEGVLDYDAPSVVLPNTQASSVGRVDLSSGRPLYDLRVTTPHFALADLRWLYPWLPAEPEEGEGSGTVWLQDRPDGLLVVARDFVLDMPGTHVTGQFGIISDATTESLRFVDVALEADPLRVESVEQLLPEDLPVEGLVIGGAVIRGS